MEPISMIFGGAVAAGALMQGLSAVVEARRQRGNGAQAAMHLSGGVGGPTLAEPGSGIVLPGYAGQISSAEIQLEPADEDSALLLDVEMPTILLLAEAEDDEPRDLIMGLLGQTFVVHLAVGAYQLGAVVLDREALANDQLALVAAGSGYFTVDPGDRSFELTVPVEITDYEAKVTLVVDRLQELALLEAEESGQCRAETARGYRCVNPLAPDADLVCALHTRRIEEGYEVLDYEFGFEIVMGSD